METIKNFISKNFKTILQILFYLFFIYWLLFFLTPKVTMSDESKQKIDSLNTYIQGLETQQKKLDSSISIFNKQIENIDNDISNIKSEKTIIKEIYHEKINNVSNYNDVQLDSFFTSRYGLYTH